MKKFLIIIVILVIIFGGFFGYKFVSNKIEEKRIEKIKEGWYIEVLEDYVRIRKEADRNSSELGKVEKGEVYAVEEMEILNGNYWYKIEYDKELYGWVANPKGEDYLNDVNNPEDIASPTIRFFESIYYVDTIDDITYDHLEVKDDRDGVVVTHKVYHEVNESEGKDQYWILYTATDAVGKSTSKLQKIEFNTRPDESKVYDFYDLER